MDMTELTISEVKEEGGALAYGAQKKVRADAVRIFICGGQWFGLIPPRGVVNEFFLSGSTGGKEDELDVLYEWEPFELEKTAYARFVDSIKKLPGTPYKEDPSIPEKDWSDHALAREIELAGGAEPDFS